jgi:glycerophosphoryl diester phosphodiesterase
MYPSTTLPQLIAQGGNAAEFPQNTLPALRSALELGANHIGFDVQMTADHIPVLLEDTHIERMAALDCSALETSWNELAEVSLGETQRFGKRFTDVGIPSLAQAAQLLAAFPDVRAFVEIRPASLRAFGQDMVVRRVMDALKVVRSQCVIVSSDLVALHVVRSMFSLPIGWVLPEYSTHCALKAESFVPQYLVCDHRLISARESRLWRGPWQWIIRDVASRDTALDFATRGAALLETTVIRSLLREFRNLKSAPATRLHSQ